MFERKLLSVALNNVEDYAKLAGLVDPQTLSDHGQLILKLIGGYYANDPEATYVDRELLINSLERKVSNDKVRQLLVNEINGLPKDVSGPNVVKEIREHKLHVTGQRLAAALSMPGHSGVADLVEDYRNLLAGQDDEEGGDEETYTGTSLVTLVKERFNPKELIQIWPKELNDQIDGGARRGHHVLIFAPTEMGKTLFAINAVAGFLAQGLKVLYVGNEDPASDVIMRLATRLLEKTKYDILANPGACDDALLGKQWNNFTLVAMAPGTFGRINKLCDSGAFDVVVLDQLRNLEVKSGNRTEGLERAATEARNLARRHDVLVVSITQAADSASGKLVLNRGDVDSSNVGIPGQCDLMIGIGATSQMESMNQRMLSFPKNKISGNHNPMPCNIDPLTSKVF